MFCRECGTPLPNGARFCQKCGARVPQSAPRVGATYAATPAPARAAAGAASPKPPKTPKKRSGRKLLVVALVVLAVAGITLGAGALLSKPLAPQHEENAQVVVEEAAGNELFFYRTEAEHIVTDTKTGIQYVDDELILVAGPNTSRDAVEAAAQARGGRIVGVDSYLNTYQVKLPETHSYTELEIIALSFEAELSLIDAMPNMYIEFDLEYYPNDQRWAKDWGSAPGRKNWGVEAINAPQMWDYYDSVGGTRINVGILDNQFYVDHEDLKFKGLLLNQFDLYATHGGSHGTHVAGSVAASFDNRKGIAGIVPKADLYGASMLGLENNYSMNGPCGMTTSEYEAGLVYLICVNDCKVINLSYGGGLPSSAAPYVMAHLENSLYRLIDAGYDFLIVKSAGNDCKNFSETDMFTLIHSQEVLDHIIVVGAAELGSGGKIYIASYSNYGSRVDLIAPGSSIDSTICGDSSPFAWAGWGWRWYRSSYGSMSGTSMAAPHVTGVAAAIWSAFPDLTGPQVKAAICNTASGTYSYASSNIPYYEGYGMLDAYAAMKMASAWSGDSFPAQVSLGAYDTAVLKADGSLWMWGYGAEGQMGNGKTWMENTTPVKVMDDVAQVSVGEYHCAAIKKDGTLWMWGSNDRGQLGDGSYRNRATPVKIMDDVTQVSLGAYHSAAIKKDGSLWTWGDNVGPAGINWGLLGNADTETRAKPAKLMDDVVQVSLGDAHPAAIKKDGSLWMWGANREGQLGDGSKDDHSSPTFIMYLFG